MNEKFEKTRRLSYSKKNIFIEINFIKKNFEIIKKDLIIICCNYKIMQKKTRNKQ